MTSTVPRPARLGAGLIVAALALAGLAPAPTAIAERPQAHAARQMRGVFVISPKSYFRMIYPGGSVRRGPFFANPDSRARRKSYTLLSKGSGGGLRTGRFQPAPHRAFDRRGNSRAGKIIRPTRFAGIRFGLATRRSAGRAPRLFIRGRRITGQVGALIAQWNRQTFGQGARVRGRYNRRTRGFVLGWYRRISGGPFNGFTGYWRLTGRFSPR